MIELRTFIPLVCCFWKTARPLGRLGLLAGRPIGLREGARCERHRVCVCVEKRFARAERDRARIEDVSDLVADAADRDTIERLAIFCCLQRREGERVSGA